MSKNNGQYGYQPGRMEERGYQPTRPGNGYQPSTTAPPQPSSPPSGGSAVQNNNK